MIEAFLIGVIYGVVAVRCSVWMQERWARRFPLTWESSDLERRNIVIECGVFAVFWPIIVPLEILTYGTKA